MTDSFHGFEPDPCSPPAALEAPHDRGPAVQPLSAAQWMVCFWMELCSIWPDVSSGQIMRLAGELRGLRDRVAPEFAAAAMAIGLRGALLH